MKTNEKNFKNTDYQTALIKKERFDDVVQNYACFGWEIVETKQSPNYENILEVTLCRDHFVKNKDELQFLQVNMECDINKQGKLEKNKHSKSTILGLIFGILGGSFITCAVFSFLKLTMPLSIILCIILALAGLSLVTALPFVLKKTISRENSNYILESKELKNSIESYCEQAKTLLGAKDE